MALDQSTDAERIPRGCLIPPALCLLMVVSSLWTIRSQSSFAARCKRDTARLDQSFTEKTEKLLFVPHNTVFHVTYRYTIDGKEYRGEDDLLSRPRATEAPVFYDPDDHSRSLLQQKDSEMEYVYAFIWFLAGAALLGWLLTHRQELAAKS